MMGNSESMESTQLVLPKHILDIWAIVLIILGTIVIMTLLVLCPATTAYHCEKNCCHSEECTNCFARGYSSLKNILKHSASLCVEQ